MSDIQTPLSQNESFPRVLDQKKKVETNGENGKTVELEEKVSNIKTLKRYLHFFITDHGKSSETEGSSDSGPSGHF